jgi:NAD-dependent dihydropyrimidine dehydrogenase PreA subunit
VKQAGIGVGTIAAGVGFLLHARDSAFPPWIAAGTILTLCGVIILASRDSQRLFRLDHFFPFLNRKWQPINFPGRVGRLFRRVLPESFFFDPKTGRQGWIRRALRWLGPSVMSSPIRRLIQGTCLVTFLILFFHVCWPYSATPEKPGAITQGWQLEFVEEDTGRIGFSGHFGQVPSASNAVVYLTDQSAFTSEEGFAGEFRVTSHSPTTAVIRAEGQLSVQTVDRFFASDGPWAVHEKHPLKWPSHYTDELAEKETIPADLFLIIDPLVSLSTAIAARSWVWSLVAAGTILIACVLIPRGFCGYLCPLGTLIDLFDWCVGKRVTRFRISGEGWWVHIKYYLLAAVLICAVGGVLISGFVAAIPVITRGVLFVGEPLQTGMMRGWHLIPPMNAGHVLSILLFGGVFALGFLRPRFWCKYVCPSGAVFSVANLFRVSERKVEDTCINCNKCVEICPFDAIKPDFTTRETDCTLCQTCGGVCPTHSIKFVDRWNDDHLKVLNSPPTNETALGRRGFLSLLSGSTAAIAGGIGTAAGIKVWGADLNGTEAELPVRPPGSVPEQDFLQMCIRCGECFKACPNNVLQSQGFAQGLEGLWTPIVNADWAGCESSCNACGQVCPTGAIRALPLEEKKTTRMGLAIVDTKTCLPFANREACQLCVDECNAAGYHAIEFQQVHTQTDSRGAPVEGTGQLAPVVVADKCVGCGLCQTRCNVINVKEKGLLTESAIIIKAGEGFEDRRLP